VHRSEEEKNQFLEDFEKEEKKRKEDHLNELKNVVGLNFKRGLTVKQRRSIAAIQKFVESQGDVSGNTM
jgi:hypothetical protein